MTQRILFLTQSGRRGASSRYRVYQFLPALQAAGFDAQVLSRSAPATRGLGRLWRGISEEAEILRAARRAEVVFVQKRLFRPRFIGKLQRNSRKLIFDFDDAIFTSPSGDWSVSTRRRVGRRLRAVLAAADLVVAGNQFLADYAAAHAARVEVLPTVIDIAKYRVKSHRESKPIVIGWIGSAVNHRYLDMVSDVLASLAAAVPGCQLLVVSDKEYAIAGIEVENRRWSEQSEVNDLLDMDIGIMPLDDNEWTRGKCALKALQYMAAGLPVVCSDVGANREVVTDGVDGFLVSDDEQWRQALLELTTSAEQRASMGARARAKVMGQYSVDSCAARLVSMLRAV